MDGRSDEEQLDERRRATGSSTAVDPELKRRLEEAYLNDEEDVLVVTAVKSVDDGATVVVEMQPPHGETTHAVRFDGPEHGSLDECERLVRFLQSVGVSPLELDDLVGTRIPATFDADAGWRIDESYLPPSDDGTEGVSRLATVGRGSIDWVRSYRDWVLVVVIVGVELLLVVVLILLFA